MSAKGVIKKSSPSLPVQSETFIKLFDSDRKRIYAYIYAFVMDKDAADEIFQETSALLWRDFEKFELNTNFSKWANGIVFNCVRSYRRKENKLGFTLSDELLGEMAETISQSDETEKRWLALQACRSQLPPPLRQLYTDFYVENANANEVAQRTGRSVYAIRKSVQKLRKKLFDCIDQQKQEGQI